MEGYVIQSIVTDQLQGVLFRQYSYCHRRLKCAGKTFQYCWCLLLFYNDSAHILYLNSLLLPFSMAVQWPHLTTVMAAGAALTTGLTIGAILALDNIAIARIIRCVESGNAVEIVTKA